MATNFFLQPLHIRKYTRDLGDRVYLPELGRETPAREADTFFRDSSDRGSLLLLLNFGFTAKFTVPSGASAV